MTFEYVKQKDGHLFFLPLCPSTNARMGVVRMGSACRQILTKVARNYISTTANYLKAIVSTKKIKPVDTFKYFDLWFVLPRTNCDAHNYGKILFDALEVGGVVTNDKFILPRYQGVSYGKETMAIVRVPA